MPQFKCKVIDANGKTIEFYKEAASEDVLVLELIQKNNYPLKIQEAQQEQIGSVKDSKTFSASVILEFTETLSLLLSSGLSLKDAIEVNKTIFVKGPVKVLSESINDHLNKGESFFKALSYYKSSFPPLYVGLVKIGEKIGTLDNVFIKLAGYLKQNKTLKDKLGNALMYPVLVLGFAVVALIGMTIFIFPKIKEIFLSLNSSVNDKLSKSFEMANVFLIGGSILAIIIVTGLLVFSFLRKSKMPIAETLDKSLIQMPFIGPLIFNQEALNFLFAMETLTGSGFSVEDALIEGKDVMSNKALKSGIAGIKEKIIKGEHLSSAFLENPLFDARIGRWISIGERSGNIEKVFGQLRSYYQEEMDKWAVRFMGIIEPLLILVVGVIILAMILTFFVPIFSIYQNIG